MNATAGTQASKAFSEQAPVFDALNASNAISRHLREQFRSEVLAHLPRSADILELNCGTGLDAMFFAEHGHYVLATDIAPGMLEEFRRKLTASQLVNRVDLRQLSFHDLHELGDRKFDHVISNFGGLNCSADLKAVLLQAIRLLKPGGKLTLMVMPRVCPWELAMALKGKFRTAFRRLGGSAPARVEGIPFTCYYYDPGYVIKALRNEASVVSLRGICILTPPEFYTGFAERYPRLFSILKSLDRRLGGLWPFNRWCDHYLITLRKH